MRLGIAGVRSISRASALSRHRPGDRCFAASESFQFFALVSSFSLGFDGFDKSGTLIFNNAPSRALRFPGARKRQRCGKTVTDFRTQRVVLRSEDSAISSVTNKSFCIPIAHPILSLRSFSRISGGVA
jgi:hypothetical protein